jgi:dTDP-4-amino-4,6-dideoxygalactose transaminase
MKIPFNIPYVVGTEAEGISEVIASRRFCGAGPVGTRCEEQLEAMLPNSRVLLTTSCTDALEMCAALLDIKAGDEIIAPSFTFVSSVNPFVSRGARIRFVDVMHPSMNVSAETIEAAITPATKAVVVVHYGGGSADVRSIRAVCDRHGVVLIEDAAQSIGASYDGQALGTFGQLGCVSFHETKNIHCGEGGALVINDQSYFARAEIIREKGTNRSKFFRGQVDKYSWVDIGSSHIPSELNSAFLSHQLLHVAAITERRLAIWNRYRAKSEQHGLDYVRFPAGVVHNGHLFGVFAPDLAARTRCIAGLKELGIQTVFHYVPLHNSEMGLESGVFHGAETNTVEYSDRLIRLPLYPDLDDRTADDIVDALAAILKGAAAHPAR